MHATSTKTRKIRDLLHAKRSALLARYHDELARADEEQEKSAELVDAANDQWDVRVLSMMSESDAHALAQVAAAIERLDGGTYGVCVLCDEPIAEGRLHVVPEAAECARCASDAERRVPRFVHEVV